MDITALEKVNTMSVFGLSSLFLLVLVLMGTTQLLKRCCGGAGNKVND